MIERQDELRGRFHALGFDQVRFVRLAPEAGTMGKGLHAWLEAGYQGEMEWMARSEQKRADPQLVLSGARSAVLFGVNYWPGNIDAAKGPIWARYALYQDYHDTMKAALVSAGRLLEEFYSASPADYRYYVDTGPFLERGWAERSGMGFVGKNAMLISREFGNWLFLAELLTKFDFAPDSPLGPNIDKNSDGETGRVGLYCGKCTRCMDACPTNAIRAEGVIDARRCISYQTIENRGIIPRELRSGIGARIYGCDICLDVCPWNRFAQESRRILLDARYDLAALPLREILCLTPERFSDVFRKTPIKRTKLTGLLRNACIVAANTQARDCLDCVIHLTQHASPVVRAHAVWAVYRLADAGEAHQLLAANRGAEVDPTVLAEYLIEEADEGITVAKA